MFYEFTKSHSTWRKVVTYLLLVSFLTYFSGFGGLATARAETSNPVGEEATAAEQSAPAAEAESPKEAAPEKAAPQEKDPPPEKDLPKEEGKEKPKENTSPTENNSSTDNNSDNPSGNKNKSENDGTIETTPPDNQNPPAESEIVTAPISKPKPNEKTTNDKFKIFLQGYRNGGGWTSGNLKSYAEGSAVPYRLIIDNTKGNNAVSLPSISLQLDANGGGYVFFYQTQNWSFNGNLSSLPGGTGSGGGSASPDSQSGASAPYSSANITASFGSGRFTVEAGKYGVLYFEGVLAPTSMMQDYGLGGASYSPGSSGHVTINMSGVGSKSVPNPSVPGGPNGHKPNPELTVSKTVDFNGDGSYSTNESSYLGSTAHWKIVVTNTGDTKLKHIILSDTNGVETFPKFNLMSGETRTFTYDTVPTEGFTNTATAYNPRVKSVSSSASVTIVPRGTTDLTIDKTVDYDNDGVYHHTESTDVGTTAYWKIVVTNTGQAAATGLTVTDSNGHDFGPTFSLAAGEEKVFTYATVPAAAFTNTAVLHSGEATLESSANVIPLFPELSISKTVDFNGDGIFSMNETGTVGDTAHWKVVVSNTGDGDATDVSVTDSNGYDFGGNFFVAAGGSKTFTYDTVPLLDTVNTATLRWESTVLTSSSSVHVLLPNLSIVKTVDYNGDGVYSSDESADLGSTAHWRITVLNNGEGPAAGLSITDSNGHNFGSSFTIAAGENQVFEYDTVPTADTTNTAVLHYGNSTLESSASAHPLVGQLSITKLVDYNGDGVYSTDETGSVGDIAHWKVTVTNTGAGTATGISVTDSNAFDFGPAFNLAAGQEKIFAYDSTPLVDTTNTVTLVYGDVQMQSSASVNVMFPTLSVTKMVDFNGDGVFTPFETGNIGDVAHWQIVVSNTGEGNASGLTLTDSNGHDFGSSFNVEAGDTQTFNYDTTPAADTTNTVTLHWNNNVFQSEAAVHVVTQPAIALNKLVDFNGDGIYSKSEIGPQGETAHWRVTVNNSGNVPLTNLTLNDSNGHLFGEPFVLGVGETLTFNYDTAPVDDTTNTVTASATELAEPATSSAEVIVRTGTLSIVKTVDFDADGVYNSTESGLSGNTAAWRVVVSNSSNLPFTNIVIADSNGHDFGAPFDLAAGETRTFNYDTAPTATTINTATLTAAELTVPLTSTATATVMAPAVTVAKLVDFNGDAVFSTTETNTLGNVAHWRIIVANSGDTTLTDVIVTDNNSGLLTTETVNLAVGQSRVFEYDTTPLIDTTNTVTVSADEITTPVTASASVIVGVPFTENVLAVDKTVDFNGDGIYHKTESNTAGNTASWKIVVTNTGQTNISDIQVTDTLDLVSIPLFNLDAGESRTIVYTSTPVVNTSNTATVTAPNTPTVSSTAIVTIVSSGGGGGGGGFLPFTENETGEGFLPFTGADGVGTFLISALMLLMLGLGIRRYSSMIS